MHLQLMFIHVSKSGPCQNWGIWFRFGCNASIECKYRYKVDGSSEDTGGFVIDYVKSITLNRSGAVTHCNCFTSGHKSKRPLLTGILLRINNPKIAIKWIIVWARWGDTFTRRLLDICLLGCLSSVWNGLNEIVDRWALFVSQHYR